MCRKLPVFVFLILLIYNSVSGQNINEQPKQDKKKDGGSVFLNQDTANLSDYELKALHLIDSALLAEKKEKEHSALEMFLNKNISLNYFNLPIGKLIDYNNYEGLRIGFGITTNEGISKYFLIGGYFGYGFKDKAWKYGGNLTLKLHHNSESEIHFTYTNDVIEKAGYSFLEIPDFTSTEIYRKFLIEEMDIIEKYEISFSFVSLQYLKTQLFFNESYITATNDYTYGQDLANSTNEFIFDEIGIQFRYAYKEKFLQSSKTKYSLGTNYPIFYGNIIKGTNWFNGEFEYTKYEAKITKKFKTKVLGKTKLTIVGGLAEGKIPISKLYNGHGSYQPFSIESENSFGTMRMNEFYSDKFVSIFFKHEFKPIFKSSLFSPEFAIVNNYGIATLSNKSYHFDSKEVKSYDKGYYECGLLINNILKPEWLGFGFGVFYRYGPYSFDKIADNFAYKLSLKVEIN